MFSEKTTKISIYLIGLIIIIFIIKPNLIFKENGQARIYGIGYENNGYKKTLFTIHNIIILIIVILMILLK